MVNKIPSTGGLGATYGGNQVFTVNNDLDAQRLYLTVDMALTVNFTADAIASGVTTQISLLLL